MLAVRFILVIWTFTCTVHVNSILERACHNYYSPHGNYCQLVAFNITKAVTCSICPETKQSNITICKTDVYNLTASDIVQNVPLNTTRLIIKIHNHWRGYLPQKTHEIHLSQIGRLVNLEYLHLSGDPHDFYQLYQLLLQNVTELRQLTKLHTLRVRIPLDDVCSGYYNGSCISKMILQLPKLETLDLSSTRGLGNDSLLSILRTLNKDKITHLCLRQFQVPGGYQYISDFKPILTSLSMENISYPNLVELDLSDNSICRIPPFSSWLAPQLNILDISGNVLLDATNLALLLESLMHRNIISLNLGYQGSINKYVKPFSYNSSEDQEINTLSTSFLIEKTDREIHQELEYNQTIFILNCLRNVSSDNKKPNISNMFVNDNTYGEKFCNFLKCLFPLYLRELNCKLQRFLMPVWNVTDTDCIFGLNFPFGENLKNVSFNKVHYEQAQDFAFTFKGGHPGLLCVKSTNGTNQSQIRMLEMRDNSIWIKALFAEPSLNHNIRGIKGFDKLYTLDLRYNDIPLNGFSTLDAEYSGNLPNVRDVYLTGNDLQLNETIRNSLCVLLPNARKIYMDRCNISNLNFSIFEKCLTLEVLILKKNKIDNNSSGLAKFFQLPRVKHLDLQDNRIQYLNKEEMQQIDSTENITLNLFENPLLCDCTPQSMSFIMWIIDNSRKFQNYKSYSCTGLKGKGIELIKNIRKDDFKTCNSKTYSLLTLIASVATTVGSSLLFAAIIGLYKIRWRLRYHLFKLQQACISICSCLNRNRMEQHVFWKYDAFISYCSGDRFWVHSTLMKTLEEKYGFRLCIHYRDFPVGGDIAETIARKMEQSREIIIIVSEIALSSGWCSFELDEALRQMNRRRTNLVVIKLGRLENSLLNTKLAHVLDTHTFLEWTNNTKRHKLFWAALVGRLYNDVDVELMCCCRYGARNLGYQDILDPQDDEAYIQNNLSDEERLQQVSRLNLERAVQYKRTLQEILDSEDKLPQWAFGPIPWPIEQVLQHKKEVIDGRMLEQATGRLEFLVECLSEVESEHRNQSSAHTTCENLVDE